jgi:membrane-associated phospholipid phosphatase
MTPVDWCTAVFTILLGILAVIFYDRVALDEIGVNILIILASIAAANVIRGLSASKLARAIHAFYIMPTIVLIFKTVEKVSFPMHGHDFDPLFITIDRFLFGVDPTVWFWEHVSIPPIGVELLQICYFSYYIMFIVLAVELFLRRKHNVDHTHGEEDELETYRFAIIYGFLLSYIGYLGLPGVGPRFTLHEFALLEQELPGVWLTYGMRFLINAGENITAGMTSAEAIRVVTRDVFPSGHTEMTLLTMLIAFRFKARTRWIIFAFGSWLIISTVLLRYHYVIDLLAGAVFAMITLYTLPQVEHLFLRLKRRFAKT